MADLYKAARFYAGLGWRIFPIIPGRKEPAIKAWPTRATTDLRTIEAWWRQHPMGIGLACGPGSGVVVIDVDLHDADGTQTLARKSKRLGPLPECPKQRTGSGGQQLFFRYPDSGTIRNNAGKLGPGLDVRGAGGYVVLPPSIHPCGEAYQWLSWPHQVPCPDLPEAWLSLLLYRPRPTIQVPIVPLRRTGDQILDRFLDQVGAQQIGMRHATLYAVAADLHEKQAVGLIPPGNHDDQLVAAGMRAGLPELEAARVVGDARRAHGR